MTGGLTAVHSKERSRHAIWEALQRREVYATSGVRILLWFELQNGPDGPAPMGTETRLTVSPRFVVQTAGALVQQPGCPESIINTLDKERMQRLCLGECYHPGSARHLMTRIEVVRIRPQQRPDEPLASLIDDPWRILTCPADPDGCHVTFADPDFVQNRRDTVYYVRAIQEPTLAVNSGSLRCQNQDNCRPGASKLALNLSPVFGFRFS
jgi:hypothetical protein